MRVSEVLMRRAVVIATIVVSVVAIGVVLAFEPITRTIVASQFMCLGCHTNSEYDYREANSPSKRHPATPEEGGDAGCVDCHVAGGRVNSVFVYTHYLVGTDLFGGLRETKTARFPAEVTPVGKKAYRVRDGLMEYDSAPCRTCHIETEIKPKRKRGQKAHANALENKETCIECHNNLVHREVDLRPLPAE